ncbi:MAG: hypothetical protein ACM31O_17370 [Bacteroidota bacterium]
MQCADAGHDRVRRDAGCGMKRPKFITRKIRLDTQARVELFVAAVRSAPVDPDKPLEGLVREEVKVRGLDQNALMWSGPLKDISEQAWVKDENGVPRRYSDKCWHEVFKERYLPEDDDPRLEELAKEGYRKWEPAPGGGRKLVGSTTELTVKGFSEYLEQVYAQGASLGVLFHANPREMAA